MMVALRPPELCDLAEIEARIWHELDAAARSRGRDKNPHPWRISVMATVADGLPQARLMVVREVDPTNRELVFFTDARSPKAAEIEREPRGVIVFWSPVLNWQLRVSARLEVQSTGLAVSSRWARLQHKAAASDYVAALAPGRPLADVEDELEGRTYFAVITASVEAIDWLQLSGEGHQRAVFDAAGARHVQP